MFIDTRMNQHTQEEKIFYIEKHAVCTFTVHSSDKITVYILQ